MASLNRSTASALSAFERLSLTSSTRRSLSTSCILAAASSSFSTSPARESFLSSIRDRVAKVALGSNYVQAKERGGILPEEQRRQDLARRRDAALAAVSPDGAALFDDADALPAMQSEQRAKQRLSSKIEARQQRKRWNATDAEGNVLEHKYSTAQFKISPRKLKLLADQIGGKPIDHAILQMQFSPKRAAKRILSTLALARDHAAAKGMDIRRLVVSEAWISKGRYLVRADFKGRARMGRKHHPEAKMSIVLRYGKTAVEKELERLDKARKAIRSIGDGSVVRTNRKIVNAWQRPGWQW
ncbi:related to 50S ribosomal protein L22 [Pseudozyma flocculosa]|uniref:Related to 50S ribosomal protein L22 n=1 Tax=Pseudozyma flocculosa TaxID=84751 RepID=A0A5C3FDD7_9BASI|nr:related to 50S ribosomal protein L22 [Pseudozyma flocculosa]